MYLIQDMLHHLHQVCFSLVYLVRGIQILCLIDIFSKLSHHKMKFAFQEPKPGENHGKLDLSKVQMERKLLVPSFVLMVAAENTISLFDVA